MKDEHIQGSRTELPPHTKPDQWGNPVNWCERCALEAQTHDATGVPPEGRPARPTENPLHKHGDYCKCGGHYIIGNDAQRYMCDSCGDICAGSTGAPEQEDREKLWSLFAMKGGWVEPSAFADDVLAALRGTT